MPTKIEWTQETWNPVTGCSPVSPGCANCYAKRMAKRLAGRCGYPEAPHEFDVTMHQDRLDQPLRWKKPRKIFVCSMSDLFHHTVSDNFVESVFNVMLDTPQHTYQILTKRPHRMASFMKTWIRALRTYNSLGDEWTPENIWLGVTCEDQQRADERVPVLLDIPVAVRFVSVEPMLGVVSFDYDSDTCHCGEFVEKHGPYGDHMPVPMIDSYLHDGLDWVICGGETGSGARTMQPDWAIGLRDQCVESNVPFFYKGAGTATMPKSRQEYRTLDGREWSEYPRDSQK